MLILLMSGARSRRAAFLTSSVVVGVGTVSIAGCSTIVSSTVEVSSVLGAEFASKLLISGIFIDSSGAIGSVAGAVGISTFGSGKGPTDSPSSPVSPSGTDDGAATGSEKTGSTLVVFAMSSIAFCKSLSTLD